MSTATWISVTGTTISESALPVTEPALPARLRAAYRATDYAAGGGIAARIGRRVAGLDWRVAVFLTAWNPYSRRMPDGWNRRMQACLRAWLRGRTVLAGTGTLGRWREEMLLVALDPARAMVLARRFRQRGIVVVRRGQPARLAIFQVRATMNSRRNGSSVEPSAWRG
jgi:hypothetical protein